MNSSGVMLSFIAILLFGTVFLCSGLVVNFLQVTHHYYCMSTAESNTLCP